MSIQPLFQELVDKANQNPAGIEGVDAVFQFDLDGGGQHQVKLKEGQAEYAEGTPWEAACTLLASEDLLAKLVRGEQSPVTAMMTGKLKVKGNLGLASKLQAILKTYQ
ncbi:SCP2 sterol-binding domain-containing protein [Desmospora profundinema]|uniref:Sterol carrier protein n=1 Tax=Desmospora profundinema TaxID=1571184 RepID=A0ABU1INZ9_9BACL|nr:SCP2 sterol-binding domain-containing protein [Desmospora profundinema]MDR6226498.1 putative sterol carrier protein [Desmospora profundinema]